MLTWFRQTAPIRTKMSWALGVPNAFLAIVTGLLGASSFGWLSPAACLAPAALFVALGLALGFMVKKAICDPYVTTVERMEGLASGDLESLIKFTNHADCVGRMTKAMFAFRDSAIAKMKADADALEAQRRVEGERRRGEQAAVEEQIALVSGSIGAGLDHMADGDLTFRLETPLPGAYEKLRVDFNAAISRLQEALLSISTTTLSISSGGEEISQASDDLSRRTEQQAANLEETAAALDQITATVRRTAEGATEANAAVAAAQVDAERSGVVVRDAVGAMGAIETSSAQIGRIIGVIDEIAFQTNLLALNAGVEAARAGDDGRGFAVVASEVRALAQRSADAAKEIKALILSSDQQVKTGVALVGEAGKAIGRIVGQVAQISVLVTEIAASAKEQAGALAEVNTAVNQMDQVTQQNAAMVEQSTAASHALAGESAELERLVGQFKIGAGRVVRFAANGRARGVGGGPAKTGGRIAPVPKAALGAARDDWEEL